MHHKRDKPVVTHSFLLKSKITMAMHVKGFQSTCFYDFKTYSYMFFPLD